MSSEQLVLLVEDDLDISEAIQAILEEEMYNVKCTFNGKEALEYLATSGDLPGLILLDYMMPQMNGHEFRIAQLQDPKLAHIPTILMSAISQLKNLKELNFTNILKKPLELDNFIEVVRMNIS
jgi:CheY-like chemotaxis protein